MNKIMKKTMKKVMNKMIEKKKWWKIQLTMESSCISTNSFEETRTIYTKSEPVEIFMGSKTNDVIDRLFNTLLKRFQHAQETSNDKGNEFIPESVELLYYHF